MKIKKIQNWLLGVVLATYVLPYPGLMPGNKLYRVKEIVDCIGQYWSFGSFARHAYELRMSDRKLVEAKVLFEYYQYPLAVRALSISNDHFQKATHFLMRAGQEGKSIVAKATNLQAASKKHQEVLEALQSVLPEEFVWQPEKADSEEIQINELLEQAIEVRKINL